MTRFQRDGWLDACGTGRGRDGFASLRLLTRGHISSEEDRRPWQRGKHFVRWLSMAQNYVQRDLTFESDALCALAGVAKALALNHGCTYYCGLWKEDFQNGLLWHVVGLLPFTYSFHDQYVAREPFDSTIHYIKDFSSNEQGTPSWSWLSSRGKKIQFCEEFDKHIPVKHEGARIIEHPAGNVTGDMYLTAVSKPLLLYGRVRAAIPRRLPRLFGIDDDDWCGDVFPAYRSMQDSKWKMGLHDRATNNRIAVIAFDEDPQDRKWGLIHCLLCNVRKIFKAWQLTCLGLVPVDAGFEIFRRVGLVFIRDTTWFGELQEHDSHDPKSEASRPRDRRYYRTVELI